MKEDPMVRIARDIISTLSFYKADYSENIITYKMDVHTAEELIGKMGTMGNDYSYNFDPNYIGGTLTIYEPALSAVKNKINQIDSLKSGGSSGKDSDWIVR